MLIRTLFITFEDSQNIARDFNRGRIAIPYAKMVLTISQLLKFSEVKDEVIFVPIMSKGAL